MAKKKKKKRGPLYTIRTGENFYFPTCRVSPRAQVVDSGGPLYTLTYFPRYCLDFLEVHSSFGNTASFNGTISAKGERSLVSRSQKRTHKQFIDADTTDIGYLSQYNRSFETHPLEFLEGAVCLGNVIVMSSITLPGLELWSNKQELWQVF